MLKYDKNFGKINKLKSRLQAGKNVNGLKMFLDFLKINWDWLELEKSENSLHFSQEFILCCVPIT